MLGTGRGVSVGRAAVLSLPITAGPQPDSPRTPEVEVLIVMSNLESNWVLAWILDCILTVHIDFFPLMRVVEQVVERGCASQPRSSLYCSDPLS